MTLPRMVAGILGLVVFLASLIPFLGDRTRRFRALIGGTLGLLLVYAAVQPQVIEFLGTDSAELRLRLVVIFLCVIVLSATLEAIRSGHMQERYAFLWLATSGLLMAGTISDSLIEAVARLTGMGFGATVLVILFGFIVLMLFHISVALSRLQTRIAQTAREVALTDAKVREMTPAKDSGTPPGPTPPA